VETSGPAWTPSLCDGVIAWAGNETGSNWDVWVKQDGGIGIEAPEGLVQALPRLLSNPVRGSARISVPEGLESVRVAIFDLSGRRVAGSIVQAADQVIEVPCATLPTGTYLLSVSAPGWRHTMRMTLLD
jgi:hypothetical protein